MYLRSPAGKALLLAFSTLSLTSCGSREPSWAGGTGEAQPKQVSAEALRAAVDDEQVRRFYQATNWQAVWSDKLERTLVDAIGQAEAHGLSRNFFIKGDLPSEPAAREAALTKAALHYASALAHGYTDPARIHEVYTVPRPKVDVAAGLARALSSDQLRPWYDGLAPQTEEYRKLGEAFVHYARQAQAGEPAAITQGDAIKPGTTDARLP